MAAITPDDVRHCLERMEPDEAANFFNVRVQRHHGGGDQFALVDEDRKEPRGSHSLKCPCGAADMAKLVLQEAAARRKAAATLASVQQLRARLHQQAQGR
jgi:hypothetical protein